MSDALADAFNELCAVCRPRPDQDEDMMQAGARRLWKVLGEYREGVAIAALDAWPKQSEWFPTEKELRNVLDRLKIENTSATAATKAGRAHRPLGKTAYFYNRVEAAKGKAFAQSWLRGGVTCEFTHDSVYVNQVGHDRLWRDCENLILECGVAIIVDDEVARLLVDYMEREGIGQYAQKRRRA